MKILTAQQMREADAYTILKQESIASVNLIERAAKACVLWMKEYYNTLRPFNVTPFFNIVCGLGNNGSDGLEIARQFRLLSHPSFRPEAHIYIVRHSDKCSADFILKEKSLPKYLSQKVFEIRTKADLPAFDKKEIIIDALFGTGLSRPVEGLAADVIHHINTSGAKVISIDMPSGLYADEHTSTENAVVHAHTTLTFQSPKLSFFFPENAERVGEWQVLDIGLDKEFIAKLPAMKTVITKELVRSFLRPRIKFSHKGNYGHALLITGGYGKMGAAVMATKACLRMGTGLTTVHVPKHGVPIIQTAAPEAMAQIDFHDKYFTDNIEPEKYSAVGVGPGIGTEEATQTALKHLLLYEKKVPLVLDADALNIIGMNKDWLRIIPHHSILTPHPKEFERLTYGAQNDFARHEMQIEFSKAHHVYVVLKGAYTCITTPEGEAFFNTTGNAGMAKGGSGDVLTGMLTGLLAQGYSPLESCIMGVHMHGMAGDMAAEKIGMDGMLPTDMIEALPEVWKDSRLKN